MSVVIPKLILAFVLSKYGVRIYELGIGELAPLTNPNSKVQRMSDASSSSSDNNGMVPVN